MSKKITTSNNHANQLNSNKGTSGTNQQNAQVHGNRGAQMNPNKNGGSVKSGKKG